MALAPPRAAQGWLITAWSPRGGTPQTVTSAVQGKSRTPEEAIAEVMSPVRYSTEASPAWLLLPLGFLVVALLAVPAVLVTRARRRARRLRHQVGRRAWRSRR